MKQLKETVKYNLRHNKYVDLTSIDIQAVFDAVVWIILARLIDVLPLPKYIKKYFKKLYQQSNDWIHLYLWNKMDLTF